MLSYKTSVKTPAKATVSITVFKKIYFIRASYTSTKTRWFHYKLSDTKKVRVRRIQVTIAGKFKITTTANKPATRREIDASIFDKTCNNYVQSMALRAVWMTQKNLIFKIYRSIKFLAMVPNVRILEKFSSTVFENSCREEHYSLRIYWNCSSQADCSEVRELIPN